MPVLSPKWNAATLASGSVEWETPPALFATLHRAHDFTIDAAASDENAKLPRYWTAHTDALLQDWRGERVFCNPPFGRGIAAWMEKAWRETRDGCPLAVFLVPARTDTAWWHDYVEGVAHVRFLRGRVAYEQGGVPKQPAPFASCVITFSGSIK